MSLTIRNARLRGRGGLFEIRMEDGLIREIAPNTSHHAGDVLDAGGRLVLPPFIDMHFHLDSVLTGGEPPFNNSGTLLEGIQAWDEKKRRLSVQDIKERAGRALKLMLVHGTTRVRTHADITDPTLTTLKGLMEVKKDFGDLVDIQITAFPQEGILTAPGNKEQLEKALELGADNVGLIPHCEYTREEGVKSIDIAFELAKKYGKDIDGHIDETDDEQSRFLEVVASKTIRENYQRRVAAGHATAMHSYNGAYAQKLYRILKLAEVTIVPNPLVNIHLQGRYDTYPKRRGIARIKELVNNGVNVALGHDSIMDSFYPLGEGNMLQVLFMAVHLEQLMGIEELKQSLDLITVNASRALRIESEYGVEVGKKADLMILDASDEIELLASQAPPLYVIEKGEVIVRRTSPKTEILRGGRSEQVDTRHLLKSHPEY